MPTPKSRKPFPLVTALVETFGFSPKLATAFTLLLALLVVAATVWVVRSAPPRTLVLTSGPAGSSFARWAERYRKALAEHGVTLEIRPSNGSLDNLRRLQAPEPRVDIGFVTGGIAPSDTAVRGVVSLGSVAYQPLMIFYRNPTPLTRLADLAGKRLAVGTPGSGSRDIALQLLQANGIAGAPTVFSDLDAGRAAAGLMDGQLDAIFLMGDSAPIQTLRDLVRAPGIQLFDFKQADAYLRRYSFLNKISLPEGSFDLARNLPAADVTVIGPTVELVAREDLNPALCDLLLEKAQQIHGEPNILQKKGEFPAPLDHDIELSADAVRFYKSGKGFAYRVINNFWIANLTNRLLVAIVPLALVMLPILRLLPVAYQLGVRLRIYRCYRPLLRIERDLFGELSAERVQELHERLNDVEQLVNHLKVPASFADQFYELRVHIAFVRQRLDAAGTHRG